MPVILRNRNLSTELGITNGAQGIVEKILTAISPRGLTYCTTAIVQFPNSRVQLSDLPKGSFPITPINWAFMTTVRDSEGHDLKCKITRSQVPIQPAFAVTGHSAQGKTLPKVLGNLHEGGFSAYVSAS
ncbi:hypothetical protein NEOLEDRAFT_1056010, partial [Neolentinus lepideus HHB14362 ss-1]